MAVSLLNAETDLFLVGILPVGKTTTRTAEKRYQARVDPSVFGRTRSTDSTTQIPPGSRLTS
jgi:hypothetical protein